MPRRFKRGGKWLKRILRVFGIRRNSRKEDVLALKLEQDLLVELQNLRFVNRRIPTRIDEWEQALWLEGLAVVAPRGAIIPVLNICFGFEDYEIRNQEIQTYTSYTETHWDKILNQEGFAKLAFETFPDEPVVDGLPASIWLECVEPTLSILKSLSSLKHRKCNLTCKKSITERPMDNGRGNNGDFMYGPLPYLLALPRRGVIRMEIRGGLRAAEAPDTMQSYNRNRPLGRNFNRRHRERQLYRHYQDDDVESPEVEEPVEVVVPPAAPVAPAPVFIENPIFVPPLRLDLALAIEYNTNQNANTAYDVAEHKFDEPFGLWNPVDRFDSSEYNRNQNANVRYDMAGYRPADNMPDVEVVELGIPPVNEPPIAPASADEAPIGQPSADEVQLGQPSAGEAPIGQPSTDEIQVCQPLADEAPIGQPSDDEPAIIQLSSEEAHIRQLSAVGPPIDQSPTDKPSIAQPIAEVVSTAQPYVEDGQVVQERANEDPVQESPNAVPTGQASSDPIPPSQEASNGAPVAVDDLSDSGSDYCNDWSTTDDESDLSSTDGESTSSSDLSSSDESSSNTSTTESSSQENSHHSGSVPWMAFSLPQQNADNPTRGIMGRFMDEMVGHYVPPTRRVGVDEDLFASSSSSWSESSVSVAASVKDPVEENAEDQENEEYKNLFGHRHAQEDSDDEEDLYYDREHLRPNYVYLRKENERCDDRPRFAWNEHSRVLEKTTSRRGPPEPDFRLASDLQDFFSLDVGDPKKCVAGSKLVRLALKDNRTRRMLMNSLNKVFDLKDQNYTVKFESDPKPEKPTPVVAAAAAAAPVEEQRQSKPNIRPPNRRDRIRSRMNTAWDNTRTRFRNMRGNIAKRFRRE